MNWLCIINFSVLMMTSTSAHASPTLAFKDLELGMTKQTVAKIRSLKCQLPQASTVLTSTTIPQTRSIRKEQSVMSLRTVLGDAQCSVLDPGTIGGMKIARMDLRFHGQLLGQIDISIAERGRSDPDYRGGGIWSSDDLMTLSQSLNDRLGRHERTQKLDCSRGIGGCRGAPLKITLTWQPQGGEVAFTYWQSTNYGLPTLVYTSKSYQDQIRKYREQAHILDKQADNIEREVAMQRAAACSTDL